jgi:restriction endonuclease S subunit
MQYSIVNYDEVKSFETFRLDAEYYKPEYLEIEDFISQNPQKFTTLKDLKLKIDGSAFYPELTPYYNQGKIPFIRVLDVDTNIDYENVIKIPDQIIDEYKTLKDVNKGDIVITKGGSIARVGLIEERSAASRDLIFFNTSKLNEVDYSFLFVYFLTEIYHKLLIRSSSMTAQPHLTLTLVKKLPIFNPSEKFKKLIFDIYYKSKKFRDESRLIYKESLDELTHELSFSNFKLKKYMHYIKSYKDVEKAGRIDAEYYNPRYEDLINNLKTYNGGCERLKNTIRIKDKNYTPKEDEEYNYIELANIKSNGEITKVETNLGEELPTRARRKVLSGDVIVSSVEGSLSCVALITSKYNDSLCSTGFYVITSEEINSETLFVLMKSYICQEQLKRGCSGTILTAINKDEFNKILIPKIKNEIQQNIKNKIGRMYSFQEISNNLLDIAIKGIEIAIEKNEENAEKWINNKINDLGVEINGI